MPAPSAPAPILGEFLRDRRTELGLTTAQVGEAVGVHQTTVSGWELHNNVPLNKLEPLGEVLDTDIEVLKDLWFRAQLERGYLHFGLNVAA